MQFSDLTILDGAIAFVFLASILRGMRHGAVRQMSTLLAWISAFAAGFLFGPTIRHLMPEIGLFGDYANVCLISSFLAFASAFLLTLIAFALLTPFASRLAPGVFGPLDQVMGIAFGIGRGFVLVLGGFLIYDIFLVDGSPHEWVIAAASYPILDSTSDFLRESASTQVPSWLGGRLEALTEGCWPNPLPPIPDPPVIPDPLPPDPLPPDPLPPDPLPPDPLPPDPLPPDPSPIKELRMIWD